MIEYSFRAKVWKYQGAAGWHFVSLPKQLSKKIRAKHGLSEEGWGRLKAMAQVGDSKWKTSIWFDTRAGSYLLPLKAAVRKSEDVKVGTPIRVILKLHPEDSKWRVNSWTKAISKEP